MIGFVNGEIEAVYDDSILLDCGFMGYNIYTTSSLLSNLKVGDEIKIYTYMSVREDAVSLFGFYTKEELDLFKKLINVNGVGPKAALSILSTFSPNELTCAIENEDSKLISKVQGIGLKTAQKVILELKDKLDYSHLPADVVNVSVNSSDSGSNVIFEAVEALVSLGYSQNESRKAVETAYNADMNLENLIKASLKNI